MPKVILGPKLVSGWLTEMQQAVSAAAAAGLDAEISGRIEGALAIDKSGKVMLLTRLKAELSADAAAALLGGAPVDVEGALEVGWDSEKQVGRAAWGWCYARFSTKGFGDDGKGEKDDSRTSAGEAPYG